MVMLDMDGVIVDFVRGCFKRFDRQDIPYESIRWDLEKMFFPDKSPAYFWEHLGYEFWATLPWTPGGEYFLEQVVAIAGRENVCFCTSPSGTKGSVEGKIEWLNQNVPSMKRQFMVTPVKHFAAKGNILIDDHEPNCKKFREHGGYAIMYPQPWNHTENTMDTVIQLLKDEKIPY